MSKDPMFSNKLFGAVLLAGVLATGTGFVSTLLYKSDEIKNDAYPIEVAESDTGVKDAEPVDTLLWAEVSAAIATADLAKGEKLFKKCSACHTIADGAPNKTGPNLWDVVDRQIAAVDGYAYSNTLKGMTDMAWTLEDLNAFITKPKDYAPGTKMSYNGMKKPSDRATIIAYLLANSAQ